MFWLFSTSISKLMRDSSSAEWTYGLGSHDEKRIRSTGKAPTAAQLKAAVDGGAAADKVDFPDPAASPLGTDAEASGAAPTPEELATAFKHEIVGNPDPAPERRTLLAVVAFIAVIAIAIFLSLLLLLPDS